MSRRHKSHWLRALTVFAAFFVMPMSVHAQTFSVDFSRWSGPPLVKDKFGVYQTPFFFKSKPPSAFDMTGLLREAGVRDLRYEMAWGKPDAYAYDQISGAAAKPQIDFTRLDPFLKQLARASVAPLLAMTYDPLPLKTGADWQSWKDAPSNLDAWKQINRRYAAHYRALGVLSPLYEIWNEPDLPGDGGKVFFNGKPDDYGKVYEAAAAGIRAGDSDARVGGPAMAYDARYAKSILGYPVDFISVHAYDNYPVQVGGIARGVVKTRPDLPIFLTEYASYTDFGLQTPISRHQAAERFFRDVKGMLAYPDLAKVYWAQWIDNSLGMITSDLHRKALFNAYKIYQTMLPVDRNLVSPDGQDGIGILAASDSHNAGVVLWNENATSQAVSVNLDNLPFARGHFGVYRIDADHASYIDSPAKEALSEEAVGPIVSRSAVWTGEIPAESVVFLRVVDGSGESLLRPKSVGKYVRTFYHFSDRASDCYADFDSRTAIARLGSGSSDRNAALIGIAIEQPAALWNIMVKREGSFAATDHESLFGIRVDYGSRRGGYTKSVLWHDGTYRASVSSALLWGTGKATPDRVFEPKQMRTGEAFTIDVAGEAPSDWNHRIILTPILRHMSEHSQARIIFTDASRK